MTAASKKVLRAFVPDYLLQQRSIILRLGPRAGWTYAELQFLSMLGFRGLNKRGAPPGARSFVFVCFGNIMRSAMAEFLMRKLLSDTAPEKADKIRIQSAGLHAVTGREAHPWAQEAAADLGISLGEHRAKPLTSEMVEQADCILAMDFQNKAELLELYPEAREKICMLSVYAHGASRYREISDPYLGDLAVTRVCALQIQNCINDLVASTIAFHV